MNFLRSAIVILTLTLAAESLRVGPPSVTTVSFTDSSYRVKLPFGNVDGIACGNQAGVIRYLGIPFAEPAVGDLRFRPPVPYTREYPSPSLQATTNPPPCGSYCAKVGDYIGTGFSSEDCLFLNIWVPVEALTASTPVPVRVYIHGGHDMDCCASDPFIDGCDYAAKTGAIQVNMQYRKGAFGLLAHPATFEESNTTGNWAVLDQQLALKWIRDNIQYFGGDNQQILLNGHSQGGQYVDLHQVAPGSVGLFQSAISQSPPCVRQLTLHQAYNLTKSFLERVRCSLGNSTAELACLRKLPWMTLFEASAQLPLEMGASYAMCESLIWESTFQVVVDGVVFPSHALEALKSGHYTQVPYMVGFATNEGNFFVQDFNITNATFARVLSDTYPYADVAPIQNMYPIKYYEGLASPERAQVGDLWTDLFFRCPIHERLVARYGTSTKPIYLYQWDITPTCPTDWQYLGAYHSVDLMPTLGIVENINPPDGDCNFTHKEVVVANHTLVAWTTMASSRVPQWKNGSSWVTWQDDTQLGTLLNVDLTGTQVIDLASRCETIRQAKLMSMKVLMSHELLRSI